MGRHRIRTGHFRTGCSGKVRTVRRGIRLVIGCRPQRVNCDAVTSPGISQVSVSCADTPEELVLRGFRPEDQASAVNVEHRWYDDDLIARFGDLGHAVVQVGFLASRALLHFGLSLPGGMAIGDATRRRPATAARHLKDILSVPLAR
jgi:hypothetical protein